MNKTPSASRPRKSTLSRKSDTTAPLPTVTTDDPVDAPPDAMLRAMIAEAAYYRAERRGFVPGYELEDWLLSETELSAQAPAHIQQQQVRRTVASSSELH